MNKFDKIFEIELSSLCNAKCSGCMRTMLDNKGVDYFKGNISYDQITSWFLLEKLSDSKIKFCGVLGDPIANPELEDILDYFVFTKQVKYIEISTNGGIRSEKFWSIMGEMSALSLGRMVVYWSIDGVTRNDYRENVNLKSVWRNFNSYHEAGGHSLWQYIEFDYNKHEISLAKKKARELGITLAIRKSWRNNADQAKFKSKAAVDIDSRTFEEMEKKTLSGKYEDGTIVCRHKIQNEIFISAEGKLWPCCHLQDEYVAKARPYVKTIMKKYGQDFNDLNKNKMADILNSEWYSSTLEESWNKNHALHQPRCYLSCGDGGKRAVIKTNVT